MSEPKSEFREYQFCPCCGQQTVFKNKKLAQFIFSCKNCLANFFVIITTYPSKNENKKD